jgi:hypothetical protein
VFLDSPPLALLIVFHRALSDPIALLWAYGSLQPRRHMLLCTMHGTAEALPFPNIRPC